MEFSILFVIAVDMFIIKKLNMYSDIDRNRMLLFERNEIIKLKMYSSDIDRNRMLLF